MTTRIKLQRKPSGTDYFASTGYRIKLFRPLGVYPRGTFCTDAGLFHADDDLVFAVTHGATWQATASADSYSEADWLQPQLVRLLGSMIFTEQFPEGLRCWFYPSSHGDFLIDEPTLDTLNPKTGILAKEALLRTVDNRLWPEHMRSSWTTYLDKKYHLFDSTELSLEHLEDYCSRIETNNFVLMRGIQALVKSDMLAMHSEFIEEASIATYISLDASFELVTRHLRSKGVNNPSAKDAGKWLYETFDEPVGVHGGMDLKYYEEFYSQRIRTIHPGSRLGDSPVAPVSMSDRKHLRQALPGVFAFLTLGFHPNHIQERMAQHKARSDA